MARSSAPTPPQPASGPPVALIAGVVALVVAVVAVIVYLVMRPDPADDSSAADEAAITGEGSSPSALPNAGGLRIGEAGDDAPLVQVYEDFQCPWCGLLESTSGAAILEAAQAGDIRLETTLMSFLDTNLGNDSSLRAANAAMCADEQGAFADYRAAVFAGQPAEEGEGWTDEQLIGFAESSGVADLEEFTGCLEAGTHNDYVADMQTRATQDGVSGSPHVFINGEEISDDDLGLLMEDPASFPTVLQGAL